MRIFENKIVTRALLERFAEEALFADGDGRYYAVIPRDDGGWHVHHPLGPNAAGDQIVFAQDVLRMLNRELHHDGAWVIVFTNPERTALSILNQPNACDYERYVLLWLDGDGDPQFSYEWVKGTGELHSFQEVLLAGLHAVGNKAEGAWLMWHEKMKRVLDVREGQTFKRAMGQMPSSARH